jgi:zinc transport system substrate-binding protein
VRTGPRQDWVEKIKRLLFTGLKGLHRTGETHYKDRPMKRNFFITLSLLSLLAGCHGGQETSNGTSPSKMVVAATFFPLYDLTRTIAGEAADVYSIVPLNAEPHEYENSPQDLIRLTQAKVFVTLGVPKGFAPFEEKLIESAPSNLILIAAGKGITLITPQGEFGDVSDDLKFNGFDPHLWVSPKNAMVMVKNIRDGLISADPANGKIYQANAEALLADLTKLDADYTQGLSNCGVHLILAAHDAFSYLARDYGFKSYYVDGLSPEQEPSPRQIARLIDVAKQYQLKYLFYESTINPKVSQTIADQIGAKTLLVSSIESTNDPQETYLDLSRKNLRSLTTGMGCPP